MEYIDREDCAERLDITGERGYAETYDTHSRTKYKLQR